MIPCNFLKSLWNVATVDATEWNGVVLESVLSEALHAAQRQGCLGHSYVLAPAGAPDLRMAYCSLFPEAPDSLAGSLTGLWHIEWHRLKKQLHQNDSLQLNAYQHDKRLVLVFWTCGPFEHLFLRRAGWVSCLCYNSTWKSCFSFVFWWPLRR